MTGSILLITAATAFAVTSILGIWLIPILRRLKYGQTILEIGPNWHKNKQGTPTMGGIMFIIGILVATGTGYFMYSTSISPDELLLNRVVLVKFVAGIVMALGFGLIGFIDDYVKVSKKQNLGLTAKQKLVLQFLVAIAYLSTIYLAGDTSTALVIPFFGQFDIGIVYYPLAVVGIVYITNSVNLTDGLDGLSSSVTFVVALGFMAITSVMYIPPMNILATALAGGTLGFLIWNFYPAKVFMGDTGSMFLGGIVVSLAFGVGMPLILGLIGIIYIVESMSVVLQVISFKTTGKRIFKMSPIHHHFELSGYSEIKIVTMFSVITFIGAILSVLSVLIYL